VTSLDTVRPADDTSSPTAGPSEEQTKRRRGIVRALAQPRTVVLLLVIGGIVTISIFSFQPIPPRDGFVRDIELVFYLSGRTAEGDLPLVDFQHGWNVGGWWVGALVYRLADGNPNVFWFLFAYLSGRALAFSALATAVWRLRRPTSLIAVVGIGSALWFAMGPPNGKYTIPALWMLALLPTEGFRSRARFVLVVYGVIAFVTLWLHVDMAILLSAGVGFYEIVGNRWDPFVSRVQRAGALGAGLTVGVVSEVAFYAAQGVPVSTVNEYVLGGQTTGFAQHYGWSLTDRPTATAALFPLLVIAPFVPVLWRRAAPETRLAACISMGLAIVAVRRPDQTHVAAVSTLFMFTGALLADDVYRSRAPVVWPRRRIGVVVAGAVWAGAVVFATFETESLLAGAALVAGAALAVLASRRGDWPWASAGAVGALLALTAMTAAFVIRDRFRETDPFTQIRTNAEAIAPEVDRCLGDDRRAVVATTQLSLYDFLGLENPTPYVQFHYDFARYEDDFIDDMRAGEVPAFVQVYPLRGWMYGVRDELASNYVPCSRVAVPDTGNTITIWVGKDHAPAEQRTLQAQPDGSLASLD
jgi:hypothetical protein